MIILILPAALILLYLLLIAPRVIGQASLAPMEGWHYAHRGYHDGNRSVPENSLAAFRAAMDAGYGIELDVQLSADKVPMVFHDAQLQRLCGVEGKIWEFTCSQLQAMHLAGTGETIPTLSQALELIGGQVPVLVEYKMDNPDTAVCANSHLLLQDYPGPYAIQSFHPLALLWYRRNANAVPRGILAKNCLRQNRDDHRKNKLSDYLIAHLVLNFLSYPDFIAYDHRDAAYFPLKLCRLLGAKTSTWTLKEPAHYARVKGQFDLYTFEGFPMPKE